MRNVLKMQTMVVAGVCVLAAACANTSSGGGSTTTTDTGGSADTGTTTDTGGGGGQDTTSGGTDATSGGTDATSAGTEKTIAQIQGDATSAMCTDESKIANTLNGVTVHHAVVVSPLRLSTTKAGKKLESLFVQDKGGGKFSGIYLTEDQGGQLANLKVGDVITVTGDVKEFYCYTEMQPIAVVPESATELPVATTVEVGAIDAAAAAADNESYEGVLVSLDGVIVSDNAVLGTDGKPHQMYVGKDDADKAVLIGSGFNGLYPQAKDGTPNYQKGAKLSIQGFLEYSFGAYQITPIAISVIK